jgi:SpoVK/Ycf46/Vps4 family AAA+-type ATPase
MLTQCASISVAQGDVHEDNRFHRHQESFAEWIPDSQQSSGHPSLPSPPVGSTLLDIIDHAILHQHHPKRTWSLLVVGPEGSGKTAKVGEIATRARASGFVVLRPTLPLDAMGTTVGAAEDVLVSMVSSVVMCQRDCILLLDDVDSILRGGGETEQHSGGSSEHNVGGIREPHVTARVRSVLFALLDALDRPPSPITNKEAKLAKKVLICSSKSNLSKGVDRFDVVFQLGLPDEKEREAVISSYAAKVLPSLHSVAWSARLEGLVEATSGLSLSELTHLCQQSLLSQNLQQHDTVVETPTFLDVLKMKLQSSTPESLKSSISEDFVDMKVFTSRDLQHLFPIWDRANAMESFPLFGETAQGAWDELRRLVVLPICQGDTLDQIMFQKGNRSGNSRKSFAGGVLLASPPGTGKSKIAYFCAAFASLTIPSIKLIDVSCTSLVHKEVGASERALHRLFQIARQSTPCIIVMDGIENIAAVRGNDNTTEGTMDRLLSTLLTELDGIDSQVISKSHSSPYFAVIGITHNHHWIDPALRRPGRLERIIEMGNPEKNARQQIVLKELEGVECCPDPKIPGILSLPDLADFVAIHTEGFSGAGVVAVCNEAKLLASKVLFAYTQRNDDTGITPSLCLQAVESQRTSQIDVDKTTRSQRSPRNRKKRRNVDRKRHGARNQDRHKTLVKWLFERFDLQESCFLGDGVPIVAHNAGAEERGTTKPLQHILDVAGGRGEVAARLTVCHRQNVVMVDPRPANVVECFESLVLPKIPNKWQQSLERQRLSNSDFVKEIIDARFSQLVMTFDNVSLSSSKELKVAIENASLLLGLHADGATEAIVDAALKYNKPFVVIPCCVFPNFFPSRTIVEGHETVRVRSHEQFCKYLVGKDPRFVSEEVPFAGRNVAIWWDGK